MSISSVSDKINITICWSHSNNASEEQPFVVRLVQLKLAESSKTWDVPIPRCTEKDKLIKFHVDCQEELQLTIDEVRSLKLKAGCFSMVRPNDGICFPSYQRKKKKIASNIADANLKLGKSYLLHVTLSGCDLKATLIPAPYTSEQFERVYQCLQKMFKFHDVNIPIIELLGRFPRVTEIELYHAGMRTALRDMSPQTMLSFLERILLIEASKGGVKTVKPSRGRSLYMGSPNVFTEEELRQMSRTCSSVLAEEVDLSSDKLKKFEDDFIKAYSIIMIPLE